MNLFWKGFHYGLLPTNEKPFQFQPQWGDKMTLL